MDIKKHINNNLLKLKVIPNSSRTELKEENNNLRLYLKAVPEKGKANQEIIKFFKKKLNLRVEIKSGKTSREKVLFISKL